MIELNIIVFKIPVDGKEDINDSRIARILNLNGCCHTNPSKHRNVSVTKACLTSLYASLYFNHNNRILVTDHTDMCMPTAVANAISFTNGVRVELYFCFSEDEAKRQDMSQLDILHR